MSRTNGYTPTQRRMMDVLEDGLLHRKEELHACLWDEAGDPANVRPHLTALRNKLRPLGQSVAFIEVDGQGYYQRVRVAELLGR